MEYKAEMPRSECLSATGRSAQANPGTAMPGLGIIAGGGPLPVKVAAAAGLRGLAFEAGATILAERDACLAAADSAGLFLLGLDPVGLDSEALDPMT